MLTSLHHGTEQPDSEKSKVTLDFELGSEWVNERAQQCVWVDIEPADKRASGPVLMSKPYSYAYQE